MITFYKFYYDFSSYSWDSLLKDRYTHTTHTIQAVCVCGCVPASPCVYHLVSSLAEGKQVGNLILWVPVSWLSGSPAGWRSPSSRSSWDGLQRSKPGTAGYAQAALWTRIPGCWRPMMPAEEKQREATTWWKQYYKLKDCHPGRSEQQHKQSLVPVWKKIF